jgi:gliding motility-associated-like protein
MKIAKKIFLTLFISGLTSILGFSQTQNTCITIPLAPSAPKTNNTISDATTEILDGDWILAAKSASPKSITVTNGTKIPTNIYVQSGQILSINVLNTTSALNIYVLAGGSLSFASSFTLQTSITIYNYGNVSALGDFIVFGNLLNASYSEFDASAGIIRTAGNGKIVNNGVVLSKDLIIGNQTQGTICVGPNSCITTSTFSMNSGSNTIQTNYTGLVEFANINITGNATPLNFPITNSTNLKVCLVEATDNYSTKNWGSAVVQTSCKSAFCAKGLKELVDPNEGGSQTICLNTRPSIIKYEKASGGNGQMSYQWQSSIDTRIWSDIIGEIAQDYSPPILTQTTYFRRKTTSTFVVYSGVHIIRVLVPFTHANDTITADGNLYCGSQVYLSGSDVYQLENLNDNFGVTYNWLSSSNKNGPWTSLANSSMNYYVTGINSTTYYRRTVASNSRCNIDTSDVIEIKIGNPLMVSRTDDDSDVPTCGMLRFASDYANNQFGVDTIRFNLPNPSTISLVTSIYFYENVVVKGPGKDKLTISGNRSSSIFNFNNDQRVSARLEASGDTSLFADMTFTGASASAVQFYSPTSSLVVRNCDFVKNYSSQNGGGLDFNAVGLTIDKCTFQDNVSGTNAGGGNGGGMNIYSTNGTVKISNSLFLNNTGTQDETGTGIGNGNGIYLSGSKANVRIENTSFYKNSSTNGGALYIDPNFNDSTVIVNSTFSGNTAQYGGGIHSAGKLSIYNTTIQENSAKVYGGGLAVYNGNVRVKNNIISQNKGNLSNDIYILQASFVSNGNNFIGISDDTQAGPIWNSKTDILGTLQIPKIPKLNSIDLSNYTYTPLIGSPVIDKGDSTGSPAKDQLGSLRKQGKNVDMGSVESVPFTFSAGNDTATCDSIIRLKATAIPNGYLGSWSTIGIDKGKATISNTTLSTTSAKILKSDTVRFVWTLADQAGNVLVKDTTIVIRKPIPAKPIVTTPVNWCLNAKADSLKAQILGGATLQWYTTSTGDTASAKPFVPTTIAVGTISYYVSQKQNGCEGTRSEIKIVTNPLPATPLASSNSPVCEGNPLTFMSNTITGVTYSWTGPNSFASNFQNNSITSTIAASGIYTVRVKSSTTGCISNPANISTVVNAIPIQPNTIVGTSTICVGDSATYSTTLVTGVTYTWSYSGTNGTIIGSGNSIKLKTSTATTSGNIQVTATANGCVSIPRTLAIAINALPTAPTTTPVTYCQNSTPTPLIATGTNLKWYTSATGGTVLTGTPIPITTTVGNVNYYVSQTTGICESPRATLVVTTNITPAAPIVTSPITYCQNATATALTANGTNLKWYTLATGGTALTAAPTPIITSVGNVNYFVSQTTGVCESPRASILVTTNVTPAAPLVTSPITYCQNTTSTALSATGTNLNWYTSATGGTALSTAPIPVTSTVGNVNYFVSQTTGVCESPRANIVVTTNVTPIAPLVSTPVTYCQNATATALTATGTNLKWYTGATGGTALAGSPIPSTLTVQNVNYFVSQTTGVCESPRTNIEVITNVTPSVPLVSTPVTYCQNITAAALTATGTNLKWYTVATGGTVLAGTPTPLTTTVGNVNYYVSQTTGICESPRANIVVTTNLTPSAPIVTARISYCQNDSAFVLTASGTNLKWYTLASGGNILTAAPTPNTTTVGSTNYFVSQTIGICESNRSLITVTINSKPATPVIIGACATPIPPASLSTQFSTNQFATTSWLRNNSVVGNNPTLSATAVGIYKAIVTEIASGCASDTSAGIDPFITTPKISFTGSNPFCVGDSLKVSSSSITGNVWKLGTVTIPSAQNIVIKSAGKLVLQVTGGNCPGKDSLVISTNPTPTIPVITSIVDSACVGGSVKLNTISNANLQWIQNGLQIKDSIKTSLQVLTSGSYQVKATLGTCSSISAIKKIGFKPLPTKPILSLVGKQTICNGDSISISITNYTTGADTWFQNGKSITGTNSLKLKTAGIYTIVRSIKGCTSNSDTLNLQLKVCTISAYAGKDTSICTDSYRMSASQANGYQTAWRVLKGKAVFADSSANTTASKLDPGINTFVWVLKSNNKVVGSDTITIKNNAVSKADAGSYINTCNSSTTLKAVQVLQGETGTWKSLGKAKVTDSSLVNTSVTNLVPYDSINQSNKFVWTVSKGACVSKDTAEVYYSIVVITVKDVKSGIAGETIKVPVLVNDKYSLGDKLTVSSDWKKVTSLDTVFIIKDTVYFKTNAKVYLKNYSFSYYLSNQCPSARDTGIVLLNSINVKPVTAPAQNIVLVAGTTKTFKIPTKVYDDNPNIDSLSLELNPNSNGILNLSLSTDSISFTLDYTDNPTYIGLDTIRFRVWDKDEKGIRSSAIEILAITVTNKLAYAGVDQTICADTITLSAAPISGYTGIWTSIKGTAKFANSALPNTKVTDLSQDTNTFVWTLRKNGQDVGKDTVMIVSKKTPSTIIKEFYRSCYDTLSLDFNLNQNESISFTKLGIANITATSNKKFFTSNLQSFPDSNKFQWTLRNQFCSSNGNINIGLADTIISVLDSIPGLAGDTIKVKVSNVSWNDKFVKGEIFDSLFVDEISSTNSLIVLDKFPVGDTAVYFITSRKIYGNEFYNYRLRNTCGAKSNTATLKIISKNIKPYTVSKTIKFGNLKKIQLDIPIAELDRNSYLKTIELIKTPIGVLATYNYDSVTNIVSFIIDISNASITKMDQTVLFRICDGIECSDLTFILEPDASDEIIVYNALSPNGDGKHDFLEIENIQLAPKNKLKIFNRWGDIVYSANNYDNDKVVFDGGNLPDGTYYYVFEPEGGRKILEGFILLKR